MKVDKSLDKKMRVDLNITFPALHCNDLHIDIMDIAGDAHNDVHDTMQKTRLHLDDGSVLSENEIRVLLNKAHEKEVDKLEAIDKSLIENYCGPCYGAQDSEKQCCNHCQDVLDAYDAKKWDYAGVKELAEQCVREGKTQPKKLDSGEGCRITGFMEFARVNGNFHIAMGDGVERNGQHIHAFLPDEVNKFNVSHVIHTLRFGPAYDEGGSTSKNMEQTSLDGVTKIVTKDNGKQFWVWVNVGLLLFTVCYSLFTNTVLQCTRTRTRTYSISISMSNVVSIGVSGMFQYFIKIVPTAYKGKKIVQQLDPNFDMSKEPLLETNRYFVTERYTPTMEVEEGDWVLGLDFESDDDEIAYAASKVGGKTGLGHDTHEQHMKQRSILPGVFFIYQVYPFAVEISKKEVPLTHLLIRVMATIGGLFKILGWLESIICSTNKKRSQRNLR